MEEKKRTTGHVIYDHLVKGWDDTSKITPMDVAEAKAPKYIENLIETAEKGRKIYQGNFYIDVQRKEERLFKKRVFKDTFFHKSACPSPTEDQDLYVYNREKDEIELVWSIPDKNTCDYMAAHLLEIPEDQKELLGYVLDFKAGKLLERAKKLNGETKESPIIVKG